MTISSLVALKKQRLESPPCLPLATEEQLAEYGSSYRERCNSIALLSRSYLEEWSNKEGSESSLKTSLLSPISPKFEENNLSQENFFPDSSAAMPSLFSNSSERQELGSVFGPSSLLPWTSADKSEASRALSSNSSVVSSSSSSSSSSSLDTVQNPKKIKRKARETLENESLSTIEEGFLNVLIRGTLDNGNPATQDLVSNEYGVGLHTIDKFLRYLQDKVCGIFNKSRRYPSQKKWKALDVYAESHKEQIKEYIEGRRGACDKRKLILSGESEKKEIKRRSGIVAPDKRIRPTQFMKERKIPLQSKDHLDNLKTALSKYMNGGQISTHVSSIIGKAPPEISRISSLFRNYFQGKPAAISRAVMTEKNFDALVSYFEGDGKWALEKYLTGEGARGGHRLSFIL
jgi:hypothetical protein